MLRILLFVGLLSLPLTACQVHTCMAPGPGCDDPYQRREVYDWYALEGDPHDGRDFLTQIAALDEERLERAGSRIAEEFFLSESAGLQVARVLRDFHLATERRTEADLADFGARLYGISPQRLLQAVALQQQGEPEALQELVEEGAQRFRTTPENMRRLVRALHGFSPNTQ
jgi:hypothetical protein